MSAPRASVYLDDDLVALQRQTEQFVANEVRPHADAWEEAGRVPRDVLRKLGELGFLGLRHPEAYGGLARGALSSAVFAEALGASTFGGFEVTVLVHTDMASPHLVHSGNDDQLGRYMARIVTGECLTAIAVTEPVAGSDVAGIRTRARRDGGPGGDWILDGSKIFITNGASADLLIVAARTDPGNPRGLSMFLVEAGTPGLRVSRELDKTGWRSSDTAELAFDGCRVPARNLLGTEHRGFYEVMKNFQNERLVLSGMCVGAAQKGLDLTYAWTKERKAFGAPLFDKQAIRQRLAMQQARTDAARQLLYHCAWRMEQGADATREVSELKALAGELVNRVLYDCVQFHGGQGYMRETAVERMARDARVMPIGGGATEVMLEEVAKRVGS
ncbi:MAG: acyl-CoA dehydrogenase family protein [Myxococcota bacterium]|nr:acyl-CoA dehydrogenase family protein [Myxococcales bacterium]